MTLTHDRFSTIGNTMLSETVHRRRLLDPTNMTGGLGGNCATGQPCAANADCVSNVCTVDERLHVRRAPAVGGARPWSVTRRRW